MNDTVPNIDPDAAVKGFSQASETVMTVFDSLQLFLATERDGILNPYEEIENTEVYQLLGYPDRLPSNLLTFIRWLTTIGKLDIHEISKVELPKGFKFKYDVKGARLQEMDSDAVRKATIQTFLHELETYFHDFHRVRAILEAAEDRLVSVDEAYLTTTAVYPGLLDQIKGEKTALEDIRNRLTEKRALIEDNVLPDTVRFEALIDGSRSIMFDLSQTFLNIQDKQRKYQLQNAG